MKKLIASLALFALLGFGCGTSQPFGTSEGGARWVAFGQFSGYQTDVDPEKVGDGSAPMGQNTTANEGDRISIRDVGYGLFPPNAEFDTTSTGVVTMHTFHLRGGSAILMRSTSGTIEWYDASGTQWSILSYGYQSGDFGWSDNNVNTDQQSYVYFGNGLDPFSRWDGLTTELSADVSAGATTLNVFSTAGFPSTGYVTYCGEKQAYTSKTATTFTVASAIGCGIHDAVAHSPQEFADESAFPRGNIYLFSDNRLFISGTTSTPNIVYFSGYGTSTQFDPNTLISSSTAADPGLFNLPEGGGPVRAMAMDEGSIYFFKSSIIYKATLTDTIYSIVPLKAFDGRSRTTGAIGKRDVFASSNGTFFISPDSEIYMLSRVDDINYPQTSAISDPIRPTVDSLYFASSTSIVYKDKVYIAVKTDQESPTNDVVLVYNLSKKYWDTPIVGWSVADWAIYPDPDTGLDALFFSDGASDNTYEVLNKPEDFIYDTTANWRTKQYTFGSPFALKYVTNVFVEGYIAPSTALTISLLCDVDGYSRKWTTTLNGTESTYIFNVAEFNLFGLKPFGNTRFGTTGDESGKKKFIIYLGKDFQQMACYSYQLEFASDGSNQNWEVTDYGFALYEAPVPERSSLFKSFK